MASEGISLNINLTNLPRLSNKVSTHNVVAWLESSGLDDDVLYIMVKEVKEYPPSALRHYVENIHLHVARVQEQVQKKRNTHSDTV